MPARRCPQPRFTLIELLVVVSIIAILAAMLLPALSSARTTARTSLCLANKKQLYTAMASYVSDSDDCVPAQGQKNTFNGGVADMSSYRYSTWGSARWHSEQNPQNGDGTCRYYGWGKLWPSKYFGTGEILYCTDNPLQYSGTNVWAGFRNAGAPWLLSTGQYALDKPNDGGNRFVLTGAAWASPWYVQQEEGVAPASVQMPYYAATRMDRRLSNRTFFVDISFGGQSWVQSCRPAVPHGKRGVVRCAADGHAGILLNPWPAGATDFGVGHPWEAGQPQAQGLGVQSAIMTTAMD